MSRPESKIVERNKAINEMMFLIVSSKCGSDAKCVFDKLMRMGLDNVSLGFWVWDLIHPELEYFSPNFRKSLGYTDEKDFPNTPASWQACIVPADKEIALDNYVKHVESRGEYPYEQYVRYEMKYGGILKVLCHGKVTQWGGEHNNVPQIMVGAHMNYKGMFTK